MVYLIKNRTDVSLYWSNEFGWTDNRADATEFTHDERWSLNLPIEGYWVQSWK